MHHKKIVEVNLLRPRSVQLLSLVVIFLAVISLTLNTYWQPLRSWFSLLALAYFGLLLLKARRQVTKIKRSTGSITHLQFEPQHIFAKSETGLVCRLTIKSVWWHAWGFTLIGGLQDPFSRKILTHTLTIWRSKNTSESYRWASVCLSNQVTFPHIVEAT